MEKVLNKIKEFQSKKSSKIFNYILFSIYILTIGIVLFFHECWEDEAQSWLIARDLSFINIIKQMRYEGHSYFWHFLLCIFAKTRLPYECTKILQLFFASCFAYLIIKKSSYNNFMKFCLLFNSIFVYILPSLLRPYFLIPILLILLSVLEKEKNKNYILFGIILCLLANTHIVMLGFSIIIFILYYKREFTEECKKTQTKNKKLIISAIISAFGIINMMACAFIGLFFNTAIANGNSEIKEIVFEFFEFCKSIITITLDQENIILILILELATAITIIYSSINYDKKRGIILFFGNLFFIYVQTCVFDIKTHARVVLVPAFILLFDWNINEKIKNKNNIDYLEILIAVFCLLSIPNSINMIKNEIKYPYTDSKNAAIYIKENIPEGSTIVTVNWNTISPIEVYLSGKDYKFFDATSLEYMTFATWNKNVDNNADYYLEDAINYFKKIGEKDIYFVNCIFNRMDITELESYNKVKDKLKPLYITQGKAIKRKTYIYKIEY